MRARDFAALLLVLPLTLACEPKPQIAPPPAIISEELRLAPARFADLPGWEEDRIIEALPALQRSCARILRIAPEAGIGPRAIGGAARDWQGPCRDLASVAPGDETALRRVLEDRLQPVQVTAGSEPEGIFTGYYEVELEGARAPSARFTVPLYRRPGELLSASLGDFADDLAGRTIFGRAEGGRFVPYASREEIEGGALTGRGLELLWLADPAEAFLLHVQGSGRVRLVEGGATRVGFAAANGHPFFPIGRALIDRGTLPKDKASMPDILAWLRAHPEEARRVMQLNRRYIFFREIDGEGPVGAEGVALTPGRSLAVDTSLLPLGAPVWLDTHWPADPSRALRRLMVAQDTGSAIRGAVRGDFYWGTGAAAFAEAGRMKSAGRYWFLLPKAVAARIGPTS
ncbi:MAG TPA: MltA domain-containing protein [Alphaproteobacteria bacterium]|nr:MltA domain-containing protein [Alphaproteobacteria bacterium]